MGIHFPALLIGGSRVGCSLFLLCSRRSPVRSVPRVFSRDVRAGPPASLVAGLDVFDVFPERSFGPWVSGPEFQVCFHQH